MSHSTRSEELEISATDPLSVPELPDILAYLHDQERALPRGRLLAPPRL